MKQIRYGIFESNSSSTHSLSMVAEHINEAEFDLYIFEKEYIIRPFEENEIDYVMEFTTVEDKLRYFLTLYYQTWYMDGSMYSKRVKFMKMLQKIFTNTIFVLDFKNAYVFEDGEWFFNETDAMCEKLTDEYTLKKFMLYGVINFGDRDRETYSDKIDRISMNGKLWSIEWTG